MVGGLPDTTPEWGERRPRIKRGQKPPQKKGAKTLNPSNPHPLPRRTVPGVAAAVAAAAADDDDMANLLRRASLRRAVAAVAAAAAPCPEVETPLLSPRRI